MKQLKVKFTVINWKMITQFFMRPFRLFAGLVFLMGITLGSLSILRDQGFFKLSNLKIEISPEKELPVDFVDLRREKISSILSEYINQDLWQLPLEKLAKQVQQEDWVESIRMQRRWPNELDLYIEMREISFLLQGRAGKIFPIDQRGEILSEIPLSAAPDLSVLVGDELVKDKNLRKKAVLAQEEIPASGHFSRKNISEWRYDKKEGFVLTLMNSNTLVRLGEDNLQVKSQRVDQVLEYLKSHQIEARVIEADLSQKVLVRTRKAF